ncbi:MAG: hypothetical protein GX673_06715 [Gammaproteobacteria bacterium]|nr:hypothetical protein [Gammaproteobacteria bacterium]
MNSVIGFLFKSVLSAAFGLLFLVGVVFVVYQAGMGDYLDGSFYVNASEAAHAAGLFGVTLGLMLAIFAVIVAVLALLGLQATRNGFVRLAVWAVTVNIVMAACVLVIMSSGSEFSLMALGSLVLIVLGLLVGSIVAYYLFGGLAFFLGISFEQLGDAQPRGRRMLFSEALESGYSKPQIRAFIDELNREGQRGNAGMVYTTLILYGIPFFAILAAVMLVF